MLTLDCLMWNLNIRNHLLKDDGFCTLSLNDIIQFIFSLEDIWALLVCFGGNGCWESTERDCPHSILQILLWSSSQEAKVPTDLNQYFIMCWHISPGSHTLWFSHELLGNNYSLCLFSWTLSLTKQCQVN